MTDRVARIELHPTGPQENLPRPEGYKVVSTEIGPRGEALQLLVRDESVQDIFGRTGQLGGASFPKSQTEDGYSALLLICDHQGTREIPLTNVTDAFPKVQIFPNGELLVVASRCRRFPNDTYELNATVYDSKGVASRRFLLGDGIEHVQIDRSGKIWVGYFDEGVFGNFGWDHSNGPVGAAGLTCFNDHGEKLWSYQPPSGFDSISDCYALNASKDGVWAYYYSDFPFVHIDPQWKVHGWKTETAGGREFAVHGRNILHYGGYGEHRTDCKLLRLGQSSADVVAEVVLVLPSDVELSKATVIGRDNKLHVFYEDDWYVFSAGSVS